MGTSTDHALGRNLRFFSVKEDAAYPGGRYGTDNQKALAGGDAAKVLSTSIEFTVARNPRMDARGSRAVLERITGKQEISWSCESYLLPKSGAAPDIDPLIEAAMGGTFGTPTNGYTLSSVNDLPTCRIARTADGVFREDLFGAWVEEMSISASGGEEPKISFSGGAFNYALTGTGTTHAASSVTTTSVPLVTGDGVNFMVGSCIDINGGSTIVTAKTAVDTLTVKSGTYTNDEAIIPETYAETTSAQPPVNGIGGQLTLGGAGVPITGIEFTMTNGVKPFSDQALTKGTEDFVAGYRTCSGTVTIRARKDLIKRFSQRYVQLSATANPAFTGESADFEISVEFGNVTGQVVVLNILNAELDFGAIDVPEAEEAILNIPFTALGDSSTLDEFKLLWNQNPS